MAESNVGERHTPFRVQLFLLVSFALIALAGVFTVLVPELRDQADEEIPTDSEAAAENATTAN